jgi:hypothetical protein
MSSEDKLAKAWKRVEAMPPMRRLVWAVVFLNVAANLYFWPMYFFKDEWNYYDYRGIADSLRNGTGYTLCSSMFGYKGCHFANERSPLYPLVLTVVPGYASILLNIALTAASMLWIYRLSGGNRLSVALYASLTYYQWFSDFHETVYMFLLIGALYYLEKNHAASALFTALLIFSRITVGAGMFLVLALKSRKPAPILLCIIALAASAAFSQGSAQSRLMYSFDVKTALAINWNQYEMPDLTPKEKATIYIRTFREFLFDGIPKALVFASYILPFYAIKDIRKHWHLILIILTTVALHSFFLMEYRYVQCAQILVLALPKL